MSVLVFIELIDPGFADFNTNGINYYNKQYIEFIQLAHYSFAYITSIILFIIGKDIKKYDNLNNIS